MERVERLRKLVHLQPNEAIFVHKPSNMYYLSGFTGEGLLVITSDAAVIVTDFRYVEQAQRQSPAFALKEIGKGKGHIELAAEAAEKAGQVYLEQDYVTVELYNKISEAMPDKTMRDLARAPEKLRVVKDAGEIAAHRKACDISCRAFDYICTVIAPGMTEKDIRLKLEFKMLELGAEGLAFDTIVASGENGSLPHAVPGERKIQKGDMITMDFGAKFGGYCADMTRTVSVGEPSAKMREIYELVLAAHLAGEKALAPGKTGGEIDDISRGMIERAGYGDFFGHGLGHGVGIDVHEDPRLARKYADVLTPGHIVTVEPGIYLPGVGGVRIEDTCVITETGYESLVWAPKELLIL